MSRFLTSLLDPLGKWSPFNPRHPLNPLSSLVDRQPPKGPLDDSHHSLLAEIYGDSMRVVAPFPNMEWWWNAADFVATRSTRVRGKTKQTARRRSRAEHRLFSLITNVHLFALPVVGVVAQGTLAIRDKETGQTWQTHAKGELGPGTDCRFEAPGWEAFRADSRYEFHVHADAIKAALVFEQGKVACFGDPDRPLGWYDNNPRGFIPYWASYRSRCGRATGTFSFGPTGSDGGDEWIIDSLQSHSRFDHQSLHWSLTDARALSLPALAEAVMTRPQWSWFHLRLQNQLNLMAYELRNGHSGAVLKRAGALHDDDGHVAAIREEDLAFRSTGKRGGKAFDIVGIDATVRGAAIESWNGEYRLDVSRYSDGDFAVSYPVFRDYRFEAKELCVTVKGQQRSGRRTVGLVGSGVEEVLDLFDSLRKDSLLDTST
jgi:hypothetical protein